MRILIHDASVLIDLISVDLLDTALALPYGMETTDLVKREILRAGQEGVIARMVAARKLEVIRSSNEEISGIAELHSLIPSMYHSVPSNPSTPSVTPKRRKTTLSSTAITLRPSRPSSPSTKAR